MSSLEHFLQLDNMQRAGVKIRLELAILTRADDPRDPFDEMVKGLVENAIAAELRGDPLPAVPDGYHNRR